MNIKSQQGFSLIELMVAVVIIAAAGAAGSKLLSVLFENSSNAQSRSIATSLIQRKMDDFRAFKEITPSTTTTWEEALSTDPHNMAYEFITDNKGGMIESGEQTAIENTNTAYTLTWTAEDYWYPDDGSTDPTNTKPTGASDISDLKKVAVTATWSDQKGEQQSVEIISYISTTTANGATKLSIADGSGGTTPEPQVKYLEGDFPDIMPINITADLNKATSLPLPEVSKQAGSTLVKFNSITFESGTLIEKRREDFLTVSCDCKVGTSPDGKYPVGVAFWDDAEKALLHKQGDWQDGAVTVGLSAAPPSDPQPYCGTCCRDHYDADTHPTGPGNTYVDACRMKRIDGLVAVIEDWKMIALNVIPNSYFFKQKLAGDTNSKEPDPVKIQAYSDYVNNLVRARLTAANNETTVLAKAVAAFSSIDTSFPGSNLTFKKSENADNYSQLSARAVFLDLPPAAIYEGTSYNANTVPLDRVPFYEENVTMLAGWIPDANDSVFSADYALNHDEGDYQKLSGQGYYAKPSTNWVTNETLIDPPEYSRGLFFTKNVDTVTTVKARLKNGNAGQVNIVNFDAGEDFYLNLGSKDIANENVAGNGNILDNHILLPTTTGFSISSPFPKDSSINSGDAQADITVLD